MPLLVGLVIALPIGWFASRYRWTYPPIVWSAGILYTIPSLVLFLVLPGMLGTTILDPINVAVALTVYTVALLVRVVADGLTSVSSGHTVRRRRDGLHRSAATVRRAAADRRPGDRRRSAGGRGVQRQPGIGGLDHRRPAAGQLFVAGNNNNSVTPIILGLIVFVALALDLRRADRDDSPAADAVAAGGGRPMILNHVSVLASGSDLPGLDRVPLWLNDPANWWGADGLLARVREHLTYTAAAVLIALLIALAARPVRRPHGRGQFLIAGVANGLRAVPTLGFVVFLVVAISPHIHSRGAIPGLVPRGGLPYIVPVLIVLVVLAIPPILSNTYAGVQAVDPAVRDAAAAWACAAVRWSGGSSCRARYR